MGKKNSSYFLLLIAICTIFLWFFYGSILQQPNRFLFSAEGDGIKNYYTLIHYVKHSESCTNFDGFNYPYGENFLYTDGHPAIGIVLKALLPLFPGLHLYSVGIINFLMLISFLVGAIYLFKLFIKLGINQLYSCLSAFSIMVLSPQLFRMLGHYSLAYSCFLPMTIYYLYAYEDNLRKKKYLALLFLNLLFWSFTHPYLGVISTVFVILYKLIQIIFNPGNWIKDLKSHIVFIGVALSPLVLLKLALLVTETHTNRDENPYGFFEYYADFDTLLLPHHPPLNTIITDFLPNFTQTWEGWSYLGVASLLTILLFVIMLVIRSFKNGRLTLPYFSNHFLITSVIASLLILLFSFGFPFRLGLQQYLDSFPFIQQFRAIGRFSWVFYFIINISAVYFINELVKRIKSSGVRYLILLLIPTLMVIEGIAHHQDVSSKLINNNNSFLEEHMPLELKNALPLIDTNTYQAIIPLPFHIIGSENHERIAPNNLIAQSMLLSYHSGLPLVGGSLNRSSILEAKNSIQLLSPSFYKKAIKEDFSNQRSFLILSAKHELRSDEQELLKRGEKVYSSASFDLFRIRYDSIFNYSIDRLLDKQKQLTINHSTKYGTYYLSSESPFIHEFIEEKTVIKNGINEILSINSSELDSSILEISIWFYRGGKNYGQDQLNFLDFNVEEILKDKIVQQKSFKVFESSAIAVNWTRVHVELIPKRKGSSIRIYTKGYDPSNKELTFKNLMIKNRDEVLFLDPIQSTTIWMNNHPLISQNSVVKNH